MKGQCPRPLDEGDAASLSVCTNTAHSKRGGNFSDTPPLRQDRYPSNLLVKLNLIKKPKLLFTLVAKSNVTKSKTALDSVKFNGVP